MVKKRFVFVMICSQGSKHGHLRPVLKSDPTSFPCFDPSRDIALNEEAGLD